MRLLFMTPQLPYPPHQGASLRNWAFIRELARRHEVHLFTLLAPGQSIADHATQTVRDHVASLTALPQPTRSTARRLWQLLASPRPDLALRLWHPQIASALAQTLSEGAFDIVQVEGLELMALCEPWLGQARGPRWVYDAHNAEADLQASAWHADRRNPRRWHAAAYSFIQWHKLRRYEATMLPRFDGLTCVSNADAESLAALSGRQPLVVPNGVDTARFAPGRVAPHARLRDHPAVVFTGKMDFRPNVDAVLWFAHEIWPRIRAAVPQARFWIVGQRPTAAVQALGEIEGIHVTGAVPDIEPYLEGASVVIAPLRMGSGTRLKVLQALSMARPMVSTTLGCAGLGVRHNEHLAIADTPETFAAHTIDLLTNPNAARAMAARGREYVRAHYDWRVLVPRLETLYETLLEHARAP
ncbi:hypothetical protein ARMA_0596 [Ardenticatena maritima]|uniref:Glycosyltransferase subfamily 4-like N-terminal domain-containing protein n=1 Tax=Ardenticatena maritima TaxID=872965 RepID=A0A0M8K5K0_9CHLR|nr:glycosyltransferase [Ardenticatena maritima]KPL86330.1 hypothetical protein SE16_13455 [Ardenticatena maritima]GAP62173.1 hypothetical protein ARMA_0596 [Ardenticatena maritima]